MPIPSYEDIERERAAQAAYFARQQANFNAQYRPTDDVLAALLRGQQQYQPPPPPPRSRFDTPDVIDMVQGADGVWRAPAHLEYRARER